MPENEILAEIRATREAIARENDFDVAKIFAYFRTQTAKLEGEGWKIVSPTPRLAETETPILREDPPA